MSSSKKYCGLPGFDIDPVTGKYVLAKVDVPVSAFGSSTKRPDSCSRLNRDGSVSHPPKYQKLARGVKKELFKTSENTNEPSNSIKEAKPRVSAFGVRKSLAKSMPSKVVFKASTKEPRQTLKITPLRRITEKLETSYAPEQTSESSITPKQKPTLSEKVENDIKTPDGLESNTDEFLKLEQMCKTPKVASESPMSTVCNLFENNMLLGHAKEGTDVTKKALSREKILAEIRRIYKCDQELYEDTTRKIIKEVQEQRLRHQENFRIIMNLVDQLEGDCSTAPSENVADDQDQYGKENSAKRRSLRLQSKLPESPTDKGLGSPVILKAGDLRKSTLTKSLVSKYQKYHIESPRIQKALDLYNSTKNSCSALLTPKLSRGQLVELTSSGLRDNLSMKVQRQCLMLQDTPVHK